MYVLWAHGTMLPVCIEMDEARIWTFFVLSPITQYWLNCLRKKQVKQMPVSP